MFLRSLISLGAIAGLLVAFSSTPAQAVSPKPKKANVGTHHHSSCHPATAKGGNATSTRAYEAAMQTMHKNMAQPLLGNADVDFVRQMIPHHQAAVDMAKIQLQYGQDERLKSFNRWVIFAQEMEIGFMKHWLYRLDHGAVAQGATDYYGKAMETMHHGMMIDYAGDADVDYVRGMIAHHQGAVDMASILMAHGANPELKPLASNIFSSQTQEIAWMQRWLDRHASK